MLMLTIQPLDLKWNTKNTKQKWKLWVFFQLAQFKFSAQKGGNIKILLSKTFASNLILGEMNYSKPTIGSYELHYNYHPYCRLGYITNMIKKKKIIFKR